MFILLYILLIIDRLVLVLAPFVTSHSAQNLAKLPDRLSLNVIMRVSIALIIISIILLFKLIF